MTCVVQRWHCEWSMNMQFRIDASCWMDKRLTIPAGLHFWLGWRRLSVWATWEPVVKPSRHETLP